MSNVHEGANGFQVANMTEEEWLHNTDPQAMLAFLAQRGVSSRKLRLFAVACSRRVWEHLDDLGRGAVTMAEFFADGLVSAEELRAARLACKGAGVRAAWYPAASDPWKAAVNAAQSAQIVGGAAESDAQVRILLDIFGNLFRPPLPTKRSISEPLRQAAQEAYVGPEKAKIAALAALVDKEDDSVHACTFAQIHAHLQASYCHVRGCWALDVLLGKD